MKQTILNIINKFWTFDNQQQHTHSWHEKQDCIKEINEIPDDSDLSDEEIKKLAKEHYGKYLGYTPPMENAYYEGFKKCQELKNKNNE